MTSRNQACNFEYNDYVRKVATKSDSCNALQHSVSKFTFDLNG